MNPTIKNIIIGVVAVIALVLVYIFFIKQKPADPTLTSSGLPVASDIAVSDKTTPTAEISKDFIAVLLSVKSIKLDDAILSDQAFLSLKDSSIVLVQVGDEGRPNPFAPIGFEATASSPAPTPPAGNTEGNTVPSLE